LGKIQIMSEIKELEKSVRKLSPKKLRLFREWFQKFDAEFWDQQIEEDIASGKLDAFAESAIEDYKKGNTKEF